MINFNSGWQAYVEKGPADFQVRLYFLRLIDNQNVEIARPLENGEWLMSKANEGLDLKPSLVLHYGMWEALVKEVSKERPILTHRRRSPFGSARSASPACTTRS